MDTLNWIANILDECFSSKEFDHIQRLTIAATFVTHLNFILRHPLLHLDTKF